MGTQMQKQRQGRAIGRVPARWQGRQLGGGDRYLAGGTSFRRLLHYRTRHAGGPLSRFRPIFGEPEHRTLKGAGVQVATALRQQIQR